MAITDSAISSGPARIQRRGRPPLSGYLSRPAVGDHLPAVVVLHELFGLNDNMRAIARRFAREGYAALAVDLFSGGVRALCMARVLASLIAKPLHNRALDDVQESVTWLQGRPGVDRRRVGVIGFCMGGGFALAVACVDDDVRASSAFYGTLPRPISALATACPIVASYPGRDLLTRGATSTLAEALTRYGVPHDVTTYPDARHSFFNDTSRNHNPTAAADSWRRTLDFFATHLAIDA